MFVDPYFRQARIVFFNQHQFSNGDAINMR
jgi:hypothetical protein